MPRGRVHATGLPRLVLPGARGTWGLAGGSVRVHVLAWNRLDATRLPGLVLPTTGEALNRGVGAPEGDMLTDRSCLA